MADIAARGAGDGADDARLATIMRNGRARRRRRHATAVGTCALAAVVLVGAFDLAVRDRAPAHAPVAARAPDGPAGEPQGGPVPGPQPPGTAQAPPDAIGVSGSDWGVTTLNSQMAEVVEIERGAPSQSPSCADPRHCASVTLHLQGIADATRVTYECVADPGGTFHTATLDPTPAVVPNACVFGTPGARVWVEVDAEIVVDGGRVGVAGRSNEIVW